MAPTTRTLTTIEPLRWEGDVPGRLVIIDQRRLPLERIEVRLDEVEQAYDAIKTLAVRGAPAIGIAGAFGAMLGAQTARDQDAAAVEKATLAAADRLAKSRPTAVNLFWALDRMKKALARELPLVKGNGRLLVERLLAEARAIHDEDKAMCRSIGRHGAQFIRDGASVLTHCNAGALATGEYGTALGCIYAAVESGKKVAVYADETRPLLQGARLTAFELKEAGVPVTLLSDNMVGAAMKKGLVEAVFVGADRIARNGDVCNKIGTYTVAVVAKEHGVPFYVAAPSSTFDLTLETGDQIPIEERGQDEVFQFGTSRVAPHGIAAWNPAFDVTPARLVRAIVTEKGVIENPSTERVLSHFGRR